MSAARASLLVLALAVGLGCGEERPEVTPIASGGPRPEAEEAPSPYLTNPHANLRERSAADRAREQAEIEREALAGSRGGGGGGGGGRPEPGPAPRPSAAELERFRRELAEETASVDADDEPCDQLRAMLGASVRAQQRPGHDMPAPPTRREMLAPCRELPAGFQQCLDRTYHEAHQAECEQAFAQLGARGHRISRRAEAAFAEAEANGGVLERRSGRGGDDGEDDEDEGLPPVPDALLDPAP